MIFESLVELRNESIIRPAQYRVELSEFCCIGGCCTLLLQQEDLSFRILLFIDHAEHLCEAFLELSV